jgi:hypothetical protein
MPNPSPVLEGALRFREDGVLGQRISVPWAEYLPEGGKLGSSDTQLGPDGCTATMMVLVHWSDLSGAIKSILGYSYRSGSFSGEARACVIITTIEMAILHRKDEEQVLEAAVRNLYDSLFEHENN